MKPSKISRFVAFCILMITAKSVPLFWLSRSMIVRSLGNRWFIWCLCYVMHHVTVCTHISISGAWILSWIIPLSLFHYGLFSHISMVVRDAWARNLQIPYSLFLAIIYGNISFWILVSFLFVFFSFIKKLQLRACYICRYVHFDFHRICGHIHFERLSLLYDQIEDYLDKHRYALFWIYQPSYKIYNWYLVVWSICQFILNLYKLQLL